MIPKINNKIHLSTEDGYNRWSDTYDSKLSHTVRCARKAFVELKPKVTDLDILEIGCGTGGNIELLKQEKPRTVTGIDISEGMLNQAKKKSYGFPVNFINFDVNKGLPLKDKSLDLVVMSLVLEHLNDIKFIFNEIARVLKPGGKNLIIELHPYRTLMDGFARFEDEFSAVEYRMESKEFSISEILNSQISNRMIINKIFEVRDKDEEIPSIFSTLSTLDVL